MTKLKNKAVIAITMIAILLSLILIINSRPLDRTIIVLDKHFNIVGQHAYNGPPINALSKSELSDLGLDKYTIL